MKRVLAILLFLVLVGNCWGDVVNIAENHIIISVDSAGETSVVERYYLYFPSTANKESVLELNQELGVDLVKWNKENSEIMTHIGEAKNPKIFFVEDKQDGSSYLELQYKLEESVVLKKNETTRNITYSLNKKQFEKFKMGTVWVIPNQTAISLVLPLNASLVTSVQPDAEILQNNMETEILWRGYLSSTEIKVEYSLIKQINIDISQIIIDFGKSDYFVPVMIVLLLLAVFFIFKRKEIEGRIEEFIINNSSFE